MNFKTTTRAHEWHRIIRYLFIASMICVLGACSTVSLTQVRQFGDATAALSTGATGAFGYLDAVEVQRKIYAVAADPSAGPTDATFTSFFESSSDTVAKGVEPRKVALDRRLKMLESLADYARALQELAVADYATDIDAASGELNGALASLGTNYKAATQKDMGLSEGDFHLIATAINAIGKSVVAERKQKAIRAIVPAADPAVQKAAALIATDLAPDSSLAKYVHTAVALTRLALESAYNRERKSPSSTFDSRLARLDSIGTMYRSEQGTAALFSNVSKGAKALGQSHSALVKAVNTNEMTSQEFTKALADLQAYVKSVQDFRASLEAAK